MKKLLIDLWPTLVLWVVIIPVYWGLGYINAKMKVARIMRQLHLKQTFDNLHNLTTLDHDSKLKLLGRMEAYHDFLEELSKPEHAVWPIKQLRKLKRLFIWS